MTSKVLLGTFFLSTYLSASTIAGFGIEADYLAPKAEGSFKYNTINTTFDGEEEKGVQLGAYIEHPIPMIPNIRVDYTSEVEFSGLSSIVSVTQTDITPYYEILDNIVDIDVGLTAKVLEGTTKQGNTEESFDAVIPMVYVGTAIMFPGSPLSLSASVKYMGIDGDSFTDARAKVLWKIAGGLAAQAGYRYESIKLNDFNDITTDARFEGPYIGMNYSF